MRNSKSKSTQPKHSTAGKTDEPPTKAPSTSPMTRMHQQKVLAAVRILFEYYTPRDYVKAFTRMTSSWVDAMHDIGSHSDINSAGTYLPPMMMILDFMSMIQDNVDYTTEDILQGGSITHKELYEGLL